MKEVTAKYWDSFAENAAPEAVAHYLKMAKAERRRLDRYIAKLEALLERRTAEKAHGSWPTGQLEPDRLHRVGGAETVALARAITGDQT